MSDENQEVLVQKPYAESFVYAGGTYTLQPCLFDGDNVHHLNSAFQRSKRKMALAAIEEYQNELETPGLSQTARGALLLAQTATLKAMSTDFQYPTHSEIVHALKYDRVVIADAVFRMSPEVESLQKAEEIVRNYPEFDTLAMKVSMASGVRELGKSAEFKATAARLNADTSG